MHAVRTAILILVLALPAAATSATPMRTATSKDTRPPVPGFVPVRTPFPCTGRQTFNPTPGWSATVVDSTTDAASDLPGYACYAWPQEGPEHIYEIVVTDEIELVAALTGLTAEVDIDIILMSDCDTDSCIVGDNTEFSAILKPGTYWLAVDTVGEGSPPGGPYTLTLSAFWPGIPANACADADTTFHLCDEAEDLAGNLFEQPDLLRNYACDNAVTLQRGGERWYALAAPSQRMVQLTATPIEGGTLDLAMGLFSGCGPEAECLAFVDETFAGFPEVLNWPQAAAELDTVWLAVDCYSPPAALESGVFTLTVDCGTVPVKTTNFGSFRARYR